jgi:hypothetical protein
MRAAYPSPHLPDPFPARSPAAAGRYTSDAGIDRGPVMHINVESKAPWCEILDDLPRYDGIPPGAASVLEGEGKP